MKNRSFATTAAPMASRSAATRAAMVTAIAASLSLVPVSPMAGPARADAGDAIAGAIIGGLIGHAIAKDQQKRKQKTYSKKSTKSSGISSAQREQNRQVQNALNHFGYPVGTPDGSIGPKTRGAISTYQAFMGYPPTGQLTDYERTILVTSWQRAQAGGPAVAQTMATSPWGVKGLLLAQRDEMAGIAPVGAGGATMTLAPALPTQPLTADPAAPTRGGTLAAAGTMAAATALPALIPEPAAPETAAPAALAEAPAAMPSFLGAAGAQVSLASECSKISLLTNTNGGYVTAATMTDANFAMAEQFCLARTYAMATGEEMAAKVSGFSADQIAAQCKGLGPVLKDHVAALSTKGADDVLAGVNGFVQTSGMAPAQLAGTAKICLGVGYATDDMPVAIGSALLLTALGETAYAELAGHHLGQGFGATTRPDLAVGWYDKALAAPVQVFAPGLQDRGALIRKAAYTLGGRAQDLAPEATVQEAALPAFTVEEPAAVVPAAPEVAVAPVTEPAPAPAPAAAPELQAAAPAASAADLNAAASAADPNAAKLNAGANVAIMAARLPLMLLGSN